MRELRVVTTNESDEVDGTIGRKADGALPFKIRLVELKLDSSVVAVISSGIVTAGAAVAAERLRIVTIGRCGIWMLEDIKSSPRIAELADPSLTVELTEIGGVCRIVAIGVPESIIFVCFFFHCICKFKRHVKIAIEENTVAIRVQK